MSKYLVEFNQLAIEAARGSHDMINRVMTKDNIGLAALLETQPAVWENGTSTIIHCVSKKRAPFYFYDNFVRCRPIFIIPSLADSSGNLQ